jgi:hypothetical protein
MYSSFGVRSYSEQESGAGEFRTRFPWGHDAGGAGLLPTNYFELPAESRATDEPHNQHNHNNCSYQTQT